MKTIYLFVFLLLITPCFAIEQNDLNISGRAGLQLQKEENGNFIASPLIEGLYHWNDYVDIGGSIRENFTHDRATFLNYNHHSWQIKLNFSIKITPDIWIEYGWDNRWLIPGANPEFREEFSKNRNEITIYTKL